MKLHFRAFEQNTSTSSRGALHQSEMEEINLQSHWGKSLYRRAILEILRQGLYNCTLLQAWINIWILYHVDVSLIPLLWPMAKFSTARNVWKKKKQVILHWRSPRTHDMHSICHGQWETKTASSSRQAFEKNNWYGKMDLIHIIVKLHIKNHVWTEAL